MRTTTIAALGLGLTLALLTGCQTAAEKKAAAQIERLQTQAEALAQLKNVNDITAASDHIDVTLIGDNTFKTRETTVSPELAETLDAVAAVVASDQVMYIEVDTDQDGSAKLNKQLSKSRAEAVAAHLFQAGLNEPGQLCLMAHGESREQSERQLKLKVTAPPLKCTPPTQ